MSASGLKPATRSEAQARADRAAVSDWDFVLLALQRSESPHREEALRRFNRLMAEHRGEA